jgi:DNA (cytosine-5)-methyltransferase 1
MLSGQTNEALYQDTFNALKSAFPRWHRIADAKVTTIARLIKGGGLARQKARYIKAIARRLQADWGKPTLAALRDMGDKEAEQYLTSLPGVGIKTARCVLVYTLNRQLFPADVNCLRIMERLGWIKWEGRRAELLADTSQDLVPLQLRRSLHVDLIQHGRVVCKPSRPLCHQCVLRDMCEQTRKRLRTRPGVVDLCCGAGGFAWGFMQAGYEILLGVDTCAHALKTFAVNLPAAETLQLDITASQAAQKILEQLRRRPRVVIAGPPCQGFSRAGPRKPDDPRNKVLQSAVRIAVELQPDIIVLENVLYLRGPSFLKYLNGAVGLVRRAGYRHEYSVLNSAAFGVPQSRQRIVFIAAKGGERDTLLRVHRDLEGRQAVSGMSVSAALADLLKPDACSSVCNHDRMAHAARVVSKIKKIKPGEGPLSYRKLHPDQLAPTLVCGHRALPCHYAVPRTITTREAARIQGFPDEFRFFGPKGSQMLRVANAVPPRLGLGVALAVADLLKPSFDPIHKSLIDNVLSRSTFRSTSC